MKKYKNEEYLIEEIMGQSRHLFVYGYDNEQRKQFLEKMTALYPVVFDRDFPMAIYVSEIGLPNISICNDKVDNIKISIISRQFLFFSILHDILLKALLTNDKEVLNDRIKELIDVLNKYSVNLNHSPIKDLEDLIETLTQSKEFYKKYYIDYLEKGIEGSLNDITLPFIEFEMFIRLLKSLIKNNSYFGIIIDKQNDIAISSCQAINSLVGGRINGDISMKIVTSPDDWRVFRDFNGSFIESIHDYGTVELDSSLSQYLKRLRRN